jgi:hypothetical protein
MENTMTWSRITWGIMDETLDEKAIVATSADAHIKKMSAFEFFKTRRSSIPKLKMFNTSNL